ncbi:MAG TPA: hypothetical protein VM754_00260 [Actinomycetota bacterium]|nr:hypothetical protein [Actinomycetota bacterium]
MAKTSSGRASLLRESAHSMKMPTPPKFVANFDSATGMLRANANFLRNKDFPALGSPPLLKVPASRANILPKKARKGVYLFSGWNEAIPPKKLKKVDPEELSGWVTDEYPDRQFPAVAIGSSNGAATHLYSALGIPWLPQTFLIPVRQSVHPDEPKEAMRIGLEPGRKLVERHPELALHHMHDANQDRIMVQTMTYFRVKRRRLGENYRRFLEQHLPPGGTIIVTECEQKWPVVRIGDRHVFQHGAVGGATKEEFYHGSDRVAEYLERYDSPYRKWDSPEADEEVPEAEWGFDTELLDDIRRIARERHYRVVRMRFPEPQAMSPVVADLYRWWYRERNIPTNRMICESFIIMEPYWMLRTGSVPYWMEFNMEASLKSVHSYLDKTDPFDEIGLMLFNHGVEAVGLPTISEWETVFDRATKKGYWIGADPKEFPMDYAQFAKYHTDIQKIPSRYPMPGPLTLGQFEDFFHRRSDQYDVRLEEEKPKLAAA